MARLFPIHNAFAKLNVPLINKLMRYRSLLPLLLISVLAASCNNNGRPKSDANTTNHAPTSSSTYTNTKYHYSFSYPANIRLDHPNGDSLDDDPVSETSEEILVSDVEIYNNAMPTLSEYQIKRQFAAKPEDIVLTPVRRSGFSCYEVTFNKANPDAQESNVYFLENSSKIIIEVSAWAEDPVSDQILRSLKSVN